MASSFYKRVGEEGRTADTEWFIQHCVGHIQDAIRGQLPKAEREQINSAIQREHRRWDDVASDRETWLIAMAGVADTVYKSTEAGAVSENEVGDRFESTVEDHLEEFVEGIKEQEADEEQ